MIGSPASRGAVASLGGAGRGCLAAASAVSAVSAANKGGRPPTAYRHGGLRRRKSIYHAMPRLKCVSALALIKCQIAIFV